MDEATSSRYLRRASVDSWLTVKRCSSGMRIAVVMARLIETVFRSRQSSFLLFPLRSGRLAACCEAWAGAGTGTVGGRCAD